LLAGRRASPRRDDLVLILAGQAEPLRELLHAAPPLAARFSAIIDFPGYTPAQLAVIFGVLAEEAGLTLTTQARGRAAAVLTQAEIGQASGNARLAVRLLKQVTVTQALRVTTLQGPAHADALRKVIKSDVPEFLESVNLPAEEARPGQYL
jgi:hypothetical protein